MGRVVFGIAFFACFVLFFPLGPFVFLLLSLRCIYFICFSSLLFCVHLVYVANLASERVQGHRKSNFEEPVCVISYILAWPGARSLESCNIIYLVWPGEPAALRGVT